MKKRKKSLWRNTGWVLSLALCSSTPLPAEVIADVTSLYHHIQVVDEAGLRILSFDGSLESRMSLEDPLRGHFQYTEYFHLAWLWNTQMTRVLMVGLGGGSTQRAFERYYPQITVETVELDQMVATVARQYFQFRESDRQKIHIADGRMFLRRTRQAYDLIVMDAYSHHRYGSFVPHHLITREFFALANERLTTNGVLCYNAMTDRQGINSALVAALYKTLNTVFPQVYLFPVEESWNVILLASKSPRKLSFNELHQQASVMISQKRLRLPGFRDLLYAMRSQPPYAVRQAPLFTDDYTPVEGLFRSHSIQKQKMQREP